MENSEEKPQVFRNGELLKARIRGVKDASGYRTTPSMTSENATGATRIVVETVRCRHPRWALPGATSRGEIS